MHDFISICFFFVCLKVAYHVYHAIFYFYLFACMNNLSTPSVTQNLSEPSLRIVHFNFCKNPLSTFSLL